MKLVDTKIYSNLIIISDYILVGILWVIVSLPLITLVPSTRALFYVLQQWHEGESGRIFYLFFQGIKKNLFVNMLLSIVTVAFFFALNSFMSIVNQPSMVLGYFFSLIYLMFIVSWISQSINVENNNLFKIFETSSLGILVNFLPIFLSVVLCILFILLIFLFPPFVFLFAGGVGKIIFSIMTFKKR